MDKMIAYCGLDCARCPAYLATQANDMEALERVVVKWRVELNMPELTAQSIICDGCPAPDGGRLAAYCSTCKIRPCAIERALPHCAACPDYSCAKLEEFLTSAPYARETLEQLRAA